MGCPPFHDFIIKRPNWQGENMPLLTSGNLTTLVLTLYSEEAVPRYIQIDFR